MHRTILALLLALFPVAALAQNVSTVTITNGIPTAGTGTVSTLDNLIGTAGTAKSNVLSVQGIGSGTALGISAASLPLPSGASTSANQSTANTSLATIATNSGSPIPDCGATPCTNKLGTVYLQSQYPAGSTVLAGNATGSTGAVVGTLTSSASVTAYICGFDVSAIGGTAAIGPVTVAGLIGSSMVYQLSSSASGVTFSRSFSPCIPASATNTNITVTTTADGTATAVDVNSWGYKQ